MALLFMQARCGASTGCEFQFPFARLEMRATERPWREASFVRPPVFFPFADAGKAVRTGHSGAAVSGHRPPFVPQKHGAKPIGEQSPGEGGGEEQQACGSLQWLAGLAHKPGVRTSRCEHVIHPAKWRCAGDFIEPMKTTEKTCSSTPPVAGALCSRPSC